MEKTNTKSYQTVRENNEIRKHKRIKTVEKTNTKLYQLTWCLNLSSSLLSADLFSLGLMHRTYDGRHLDKLKISSANDFLNAVPALSARLKSSEATLTVRENKYEIGKQIQNCIKQFEKALNCIFISHLPNLHIRAKTPTYKEKSNTKLETKYETVLN
jgi:hypothetical protein